MIPRKDFRFHCDSCLLASLGREYLRVEYVFHAFTLILNYYIWVRSHTCTDGLIYLSGFKRSTQRSLERTPEIPIDSSAVRIHSAASNEFGACAAGQSNCRVYCIYR